MQDYEACLDTVLFHSHRLQPATVTTLLGCFNLPVYASKLLEGEPKQAMRAGEQSSGWAKEESAKVKDVICLSTLTCHAEDDAASSSYTQQLQAAAALSSGTRSTSSWCCFV